MRVVPSVIRALVGLAIVGCGGTAEGAPPAVASAPAGSSQPEETPADEAPGLAVVEGAWSRTLLGGPATSPGGLFAEEGGVSYLLTSVDHAPILLRRDPAGGAEWQRAEIDVGRAVGGALARDAALVLPADPFAMTFDVVVVSRGSTEVLARQCPLSHVGSARLLAPDTITYACDADRVVVRRTASVWTTLATLRFELAEGAVGNDGTVFLLDGNLSDPLRSWTIRGAAVTEEELTGVGSVGDVELCGGTLHATFERPHAHGGTPALGSWRDGAWQLETIADDVRGSGVLALDERCRPFVAIGDVVYSRGRDGWTASALADPDGAWITHLAAHDGRVYAAYRVVTDSSHAGLAWARLAFVP